MNIESIRKYCLNLPAVTEDVKWNNDLCFLVGNKMFCVVPLEGVFTVCFKVMDEEYDKLIAQPGIIPAPYLARYQWVLIESPEMFSEQKMHAYIKQSYDLIRTKLPKKTLKEIGLG